MKSCRIPLKISFVLFACNFLTVGCLTEPADEYENDVVISETIQPCQLQAPPDTKWPHRAMIGGVDLNSSMTDDEVKAMLQGLKSENATVAEVDVDFSQYLDDGTFIEDANFLARVSCMAHELGLRTAVYYPSLEVITENGFQATSTMFKDHPDWVQIGIDKKPNVFYGSEEFWVPEGDESAWMCPNGPYREYYLKRVKALAATGVDAIWVDVPLFMDTGTAWPCTCQYCAAAFSAWWKERWPDKETQFAMPSSVDFNSHVFRAWLRWRHETLADFLRAVRDAVHAVNPDVKVVVENFPMDYLDATDKGLDGAFVNGEEGFFRVWEVDSVSNVNAMKWASPEDFTSKIAMFKWARSVDGTAPSWTFSYGSEPLDAGLVMAAALATGLAPFEVKTPIMTESVGDEFRSKWFGFAASHQEFFPMTNRRASVGVWYSSATRDYRDYTAEDGHFGLYVTTDPPVADSDWWATEEEDSCAGKPHLGEWRGAVNALSQFRVPFSVVISPGSFQKALDGLHLLWLPSVTAMTDEEIQAIKNFVSGGGIVYATGDFPGEMDDFGGARALNPMKELFGMKEGSAPGDRVFAYGKGLVVYKKNPLGRWGFESYTDEDEAADALTELERWMGIHSHTSIFVDKPRWLFIETAQESEGRHLLYIVDFSGLKMPLIQQTNEITVTYDVPDGMKLTSAVKFDPWNTDVTLAPIKKGNLIYEMKFSIERFTVIELTLAPEEKTQDKPIGTLVFADSLREEAAVSGLAFVLGKMRDPSLPEPWRYGVWTNVIDSGLNPERYAYGHMMTSEHMGLLLQTAACMGDKKAFEESLMFLRNLMFSQDYHVVNWAMNPVKKLPVLQQDVEGEPWRNGNAPLDDFRIVKGLLQGANTFGNVEAETLAGEILRGLYWTSVTDRDRDDEKDFPEYAGGLIGYAWNWEGTDDDSLSPHSRATGIGELDIDLIPIDYQDLEAIGKAVEIYPLWSTVFVSSLKLLLDAEIAIGGKPSGLFWNGLDNEKMQFTGDFENPDNNKGMNLKVIQILWTAISLAQATESQSDILDIEMKKASLEAAGRTLHFFKTFYGVYGRIPEYLTPEGLDVPDCTPTVSGCLEKELDNLFEGEARIYTLAARLALILSDGEFASKLIEDKILTDRIADPSHPFYGQIGVSTANENDAEAWNVLESVLTICQEASFK